MLDRNCAGGISTKVDIMAVARSTVDDSRGSGEFMSVGFIARFSAKQV